MQAQKFREKALSGLEERGLEREVVKEALDRYMAYDSERSTYRATDLQRVWKIAQGYSSWAGDGGPSWPARPPRSTITAERLVEALQEDVELVRRELEDRAGGELELPFEDYAAAVRWIEGETWREDGAPGEKLALVYGKPGDKSTHAMPLRSGGPLGPFTRFVEGLARTTSFNEPQIVAFVLADLPPVEIPFAISGSRHILKLRSGSEVHHHEIQLTIRTPDLSFEDLRKLYNNVRERFGVKGKARLDEKDLAIDRAVRKRGGVPDEGRVAFWEEVKTEVNGGVANDRETYKDWRGPYQRWRDKLQDLTPPSPPA